MSYVYIGSNNKEIKANLEIKAAYVEVFSSPQGQKVLEDLTKRFVNRVNLVGDYKTIDEAVLEGRYNDGCKFVAMMIKCFSDPNSKSSLIK